MRLQGKIYKIFFVTNFYTRSSPNGHSHNRTTLLMATLWCCVLKAILEVPRVNIQHILWLISQFKRRDAGNILVSFQRRWTSIYYFLDSQIFDQVLDIFPRLSYWFTFIMLNVGMVDNLEFWYTIFTLLSFTQTSQSRVITFFFVALIRAFAVFLFKESLFIVLWIFTSNISPLPLCGICGDQIKDQIKHKVNTNCLVSEFTKKNRKDLFTIGFSKCSSTVEKIKERGQISTLNDVFHYSLNTDSLGWILTSQVQQQAKKAPDAWSPCVLATWNKKHFYMGPVCFYQNLASHATETTTSLIGLEYSNTPTIPCNE